MRYFNVKSSMIHCYCLDIFESEGRYGENKLDHPKLESIPDVAHYLVCNIPGPKKVNIELFLN